MTTTQAEEIRNNLIGRACSMGAEAFLGSLSLEEKRAIGLNDEGRLSFWLRATRVERSVRVPFTTTESALFPDRVFWYAPITPVADNDDLAKSARLILYHDRNDGPRLFVAPAGDLQAGWVVGIGV